MTDAGLRIFPHGSVGAIGRAWFTPEKTKEELEDEEDEEHARPHAGRTQAHPRVGHRAGEAAGNGFWRDFSASAGVGLVYERRPSRTSDSRPGWVRQLDVSVEWELEFGDRLTITPEVGLTSARYLRQPELNADEPYAGLVLAWRATPNWTLSLREESFWDLTPTLGAREFAAHAVFARAQFDASHSPSRDHRWQWYLETVSSRAQPRDHDFRGFATGIGDAVRLIPHALSLQIQAGVSFLEYPNFDLEGGGRRRGWNTFVRSALVWRPSSTVEVSAGLEWRRSRESGPLYRFNDVRVPVRITFGF